MFGKLLGAIVGSGIGLAAQSPAAILLLGLVGLGVGHLVDSLNTPAEEPLPPEDDEDLDEEALEEFIDEEDAVEEDTSQPPVETAAPAYHDDPYLSRELCALFVEVARADGEVSRDEVKIIRQYFQIDLEYPPRAMQRVRNQLKVAVTSERDLDEAARTCKVALDETSRFLLLDALYALALVDGDLKRSERDALRRAAEGLGLSVEEHRSITHRHLGDGAPHYAVLGVDATATDDELKSVFRRLAAQHHPDKFAHLGPRAVDAATTRFRELQDAYEAIKQLRNL